MPIQKFTMQQVDDEIGQLIEQTQQAQTAQTQKQPPEIIKQLIEKAKAKRTVK